MLASGNPTGGGWSLPSLLPLRYAREHICVIDDPVTGGVPLVRTVVLPKKARLLLCGTCKAALEQPRSGYTEYIGIEH